MGPNQTKYVTRTALERNNRELKQAIEDLPFPSKGGHEYVDAKCKALLERAIENNNALLETLKELDF